MKKLALATLLALSTSAAFAGFNGNTAQGGFQGGNQGQQLTVKQALSAKDNSMITLVGNITQQIDGDEYIFTDGTDQIKVEIKNRVWNGLNVGPQDKIRVYGKLDNEIFEKPELEVIKDKSAVNIMRVLLVEDDPLIGNGLQIGLTKSGFIVDWFTDGQSGLNALIGAPYDAVVLDLTLPKLDGLDVLKQWRSNNQDVPVLILTARDTLDERIKGIQQGADDYLCKPFALAEVVVRLQALIRRRYGQVKPQIEHGNVKLDPAQRKAWLNEDEITLTGREYKLLELFMLNKERVLSRATIEENVKN